MMAAVADAEPVRVASTEPMVPASDAHVVQVQLLQRPVLVQLEARRRKEERQHDGSHGAHDRAARPRRSAAAAAAPAAEAEGRGARRPTPAAKPAQAAAPGAIRPKPAEPSRSRPPRRRSRRAGAAAGSGRRRDRRRRAGGSGRQLRQSLVGVPLDCSSSSHGASKLAEDGRCEHRFARPLIIVRHDGARLRVAAVAVLELLA